MGKHPKSGRQSEKAKNGDWNLNFQCEQHQKEKLGAEWTTNKCRVQAAWKELVKEEQPSAQQCPGHSARSLLRAKGEIIKPPVSEKGCLQNPQVLNPEGKWPILKQFRLSHLEQQKSGVQNLWNAVFRKSMEGETWAKY